MKHRQNRWSKLSRGIFHTTGIMLSVWTEGSCLGGPDWCWGMVCASLVFLGLYSSPSLSLWLSHPSLLLLLLLLYFTLFQLLTCYLSLSLPSCEAGKDPLRALKLQQELFSVAVEMHLQVHTGAKVLSYTEKLFVPWPAGDGSPFSSEPENQEHIMEARCKVPQ